MNRVLSLSDVVLRPPTADELPLLVSLRNRERRWFAHQTELPLEQAGTWIATRHEYDRLHCIVYEDTIVGTIGWTKLPGDRIFYEVGRLISDYRVTHDRGLRVLLRDKVRIGAYLAMDHLFFNLKAEIVYARIRPENGLIRSMMREFGLQRCAWPFPDPSLHSATLECWGINTAAWSAIRDEIRCRSSN
jgi:hypothetical protein